MGVWKPCNPVKKMDWHNIKKELETWLPEAAGFKWSGRDSERILHLKRDIWYGVKGLVRHGNTFVCPIVVEAANGTDNVQVYDNELSPLADVVMALDRARSKARVKLLELLV